MGKATCLTKKIVRTEFKALGWCFLIGLCLTGLLFFSDDVFAVETIEDFDTYPVNTELEAPVGNWIEDFSYPMKVSDDKFYSVPHSAYFNWNLGYRNARLDLRENNTTDLAFKIYLEKCWIGKPFFITFYDWDLTIFAGFQTLEPIDDECGIVGYQVPNGSHYFIGSVPLNTWITWVFEQSVIGSLSYVRYSLNNGVDFTDWLPIHEGIVRPIDVIGFGGNADNVFYIDDITSGLSICEYGDWSACENYDDCIGAGGQWFFSMLLGQDYCGEPTPRPELCGTFWNCMDCETEFTCLEDKIGFCEWENRGFGERCYMIETISEQDWEVPELDDCSLLSGVENLLCEIKNSLLGVFMPTQEKISDLYLTLGVFKQKFPFNYVESLKTFFNDVSKSFDEERAIPIKILGQESEVNFEFWEQETEIGGVGETLKNVLFDVSTFVILMGFFVWLISLIKRFF